MLGGSAPEPFELDPGVLDQFATPLETLLQFLLSGFDLPKLLFPLVGHRIPR